MAEAEKLPEGENTDSGESLAQKTNLPEVTNARRGVRFRLRTALALTALAAVYCAYEARIIERGKHHHSAKQHIKDLGGYASCGSSDGRSELHQGDILYHWDKWANDSFLHHFDRYLDRITFIRLDETKLTERELQALDLPSIATLEVLNLARTPITDDYLKEIGNIPNLKELWLSQTAIGDDGLKHLSHAKNLRTLSLSETNITDEGLQALAGLSELECLVLNKTRVTRVGLRTVVRNHPKLSNVSLSDMDIGDEDLSLLTALPRLEALGLEGTSITDRGLAHLANVKNLNDLYLNRTNITGSGISLLRHLRRLEHISMEKAAITDEGLIDGFSKPEDFAALFELGLSGTKITGKGLKSALALPRLDNLFLESMPNIRDEDLSLFAPLQNAGVEVYLDGNPQITLEGLRHFSRASSGPSRVRMHLSDTGISQSDMNAIYKEDGIHLPQVLHMEYSSEEKKE